MRTPPDIAVRLRAARTAKRLSRRAAETRSGISARTIQYVEEHGTGNLELIAALASAYGVHPIELAFDQKTVRDFLARSKGGD